MTTNAVVMTVLTCIVDKQSLSTFQLLGLISGLMGAFIIAMGDIIYAKFKQKKEISQVQQDLPITAEK